MTPEQAEKLTQAIDDLIMARLMWVSRLEPPPAVDIILKVSECKTELINTLVEVT